ncbi:hypothetical protein [Bailinhaonella thermotolerans]|nr:hypothetical protein [Bailinhaonella thermotolerans]
MNHVPPFWSAAYAPRRGPLTRVLARAAIRLSAFVRALAQADHHTFASF